MLNRPNDPEIWWGKLRSLAAKVCLSDLASRLGTIGHFLRSSLGKEISTRAIDDMPNDQRSARSQLLSEKEIHFYAREPLLNRNGKVMGSLLLLGTRTRHINEQEQELLHTGAKAAVEGLEARAVCVGQLRQIDLTCMGICSSTRKRVDRDRHDDSQGAIIELFSDN